MTEYVFKYLIFILPNRGHASHGLENILHLGTITSVVQLNGHVRGASVIKHTLGHPAETTCGFGKHHHTVILDCLLDEGGLW